MWIVTNRLIFSLYTEDTVELEAETIRINRNGSPEEFMLKFSTPDEARTGWKKLQDAIKKGYQNVSIYECEATRAVSGRKGRIF